MPFPLLIIAVPLLLVLLVFLVWAGIHIIGAFRHRQRPRLFVMIGFWVGLLLLDGVLSLALMLNAALSHSEAAKSAAAADSLLLSLVLVVLPALLLFVLYRRIGSRNPADSG